MKLIHKLILMPAVLGSMSLIFGQPIVSTALADDYQLNDQIVADIESDGREVGEPREVKKASAKKSSSVVSNVLLYLPNRLFDLMDIFRVRVRVGPGVAVGARVTKPLTLYLGSYATVYGGLPGPRRESTVPQPLGLESHNGFEVSVFDVTADSGMGPNYSPTELGVSLHGILAGVDVGIDPWEIVDFFGGIFTFDVVGDDL